MFVFKIANIYYSLLFILLHNFLPEKEKKKPTKFFLIFPFSLIFDLGEVFCKKHHQISCHTEADLPSLRENLLLRTLC